MYETIAKFQIGTLCVIGKTFIKNSVIAGVRVLKDTTQITEFMSESKNITMPNTNLLMPIGSRGIIVDCVKKKLKLTYNDNLVPCFVWFYKVLGSDLQVYWVREEFVSVLERG